MKHLKRTASLILALALALVLAVPVMAAGDTTTYSITINNSTEGHTYEAYQIFTGDLATNKAGNKVLSNIVWGSGISETGQTALQTKYDTAETKSAAGVAEALTDANAVQFAKDAAGYLTTTKVESTYNETDQNYTISGLVAGYYLIKDKEDSLANADDAYTEYIIQVVENVTADPKSDVSEVEKKVKDTNDSTGETSGWQDSADYDIGDSVPFQLKATLADNVSSYTTYKVVFHDTLSAGLTYNNDAKVFFNGNDVTSYFTITASNGTLTISCDNVKEFGATDNSVITVDYTATLNENAVLGSDGNINEVYLQYSNNPNKSEEGDNETGDTPEDKVVVFTYEVIINKTDSEGESLTGAAFKLEKLIKGADSAADTWVLVKEFTIDEENPASTFTFTGLDDGTYKLTETVTPAGYNTIDPIEFTITAEHDVLSDNPALTSLSGSAATGALTFTSNTAEGSLSSNVINQSGATLPETGGIGTTIFYVLGAVLVVGAGVVLVTKKRMG